MIFAFGALTGATCVVLGILIVRQVFASAIIRQFTAKSPPLMAWRLLSVRQLDGLLREAMASFAGLLSRRDVARIQSKLRKHHINLIRNYEAMDAIEDVSAFMAEHDLPFSCHDALAAERPVCIDAGKDRPAEYFPFSPPPGPIRMPAEFEPIRSVLLTWPTQYPSRWQAHAALAAKISKAADVHIVVQNAGWAAAALAYIRRNGAKAERIGFIYAPSDDLWIRDYGPTLVSTANGPTFIANPYVPNGLGFHKRDHDLPVEIARAYGVPVHRIPLIVEGGNLISDGQGRLFMARSIFQHNVDFSEAEIRGILKAYYGADEVIFLPDMPAELTGHADFVVKLASPTAAWVTKSERGHPWHDALEDAARIMANTHRVVRLPMAPAKAQATEYCPANALTVNGHILFPSYDAETDGLASERFRDLLPHVTLDSVDYRPFTVGALHCQTKEVPAL